jgi:hypothetical protein
MPFSKNHEYRWEKQSDRTLDKQPICFKGYEGQKLALQAIPNWQEKFRKFTDELIKDSEQDQ